MLVEMLSCLSEESIQRRFFRPLKNVEAIWREAARVAGADPAFHTALIMTSSEGEQEYAVALGELAIDPGDPSVAEFAVVVRDDYQHEGLGRMLLEMLAQIAILRGVRALRADMLAENRAVHKLVRGMGMPYTAQTRQGTTVAMIQLNRA
jgi:acetyltransferase